MSLVLITGATGFIGSQVVLQTLEAGHNVHLVVRRPEQTDKLRQIFSKYDERLSFVMLPDITAPGGFDEALQGVDYVIHVASPIAGKGESDLLTPAVKGTVSVLESAMKVPSIRKVVITASILSIIPLTPPADDAVVKEDNDFDFTFDAESPAALSPIGQYHASKIAAHKAVTDFVATKNPSFDVVTIHPVLVFGRSLIQETAEELSGSNGMLFQTLMSETPFGKQFLGVHVSDVASAHVRALTKSGTSIKGVQPYLVSSKARPWREVHDFVKSQYPGLAIKLPQLDTLSYKVDTTRAQRELGIEFRGMEMQVADLLDQQLELRR
ncbi:flavonol reductase [Aspergillus alliaceus]|uniref:Flavonol reductase n=1 Tax=Petromyces alliaceus TaxID=209559 RepID=A0A5N7BRS5_PETAA|nr:flavonol reductase [Aspergillus alliaceus]